MALYNEINVGRFNRFLQKHLGMKGHPPAPQLSSDMQVGFNIHSDNENLYLEGWESFGVNVLQPAQAGLLNEVRLSNPSTSNVIALVTKVSASSAGIARIDLQIGPQAALLGTSQLVRSLDARGRAQSTLLCTTATPAAQSQIGANIDSLYSGGSGIHVDLLLTSMHAIVLPPLGALQLSSAAVNIQTNLGFWWRERFLEEGERF